MEQESEESGEQVRRIVQAVEAALIQIPPSETHPKNIFYGLLLLMVVVVKKMDINPEWAVKTFLKALMYEFGGREKFQEAVDRHPSNEFNNPETEAS